MLRFILVSKSKSALVNLRNVYHSHLSIISPMRYALLVKCRLTLSHTSKGLDCQDWYSPGNVLMFDTPRQANHNPIHTRFSLQCTFTTLIHCNTCFSLVEGTCAPRLLLLARAPTPLFSGVSISHHDYQDALRFLNAAVCGVHLWTVIARECCFKYNRR
jgi:hypothetical protein